MSVLMQVAIAFISLAIASRISKYFKSFFPPFYIIMGIILGPLVLGWTTNREIFQLLADLGLIFLMFYLGYEFSLTRTLRQKKSFIIIGVIDFVINFGLGILIGFFLELSILYIIVLAGIIYMSSSSIITKSLIQLGAIKEREGQLVMGIMVFEDFVMIIFIVVIGAFASQTGVGSFLSMTKEIGIPIIFSIVLVYLFRKYHFIIDWIIGHKSHEVSHLGFMALVLAVVSIAMVLNVKIALSAFLIGLIVSEAESKEDIEPVVIKFRDIFGGIFFFYFGMTFTFSGIPYSALTVILIVLVATFGKITSGVILWYKNRCSLQDALFIGIITVPRGEFSLIIAGLVVVNMPGFLDLSIIIVLATSLLTTIFFWIINLTCHTLDICMMSNRLISKQETI